MSGVLENIRVLDFGRYIAGPYCATLLGYLGADVIRIERPGGGEDRFIAPIDELDAGSIMMQTGCNKRSLTLNMKHEQSREVIDRLVKSADVIVANLPAAFLEKIGLNFERVHELNPRAVLTTLTAFGDSGPWSNRGGFDGVGQAMSGAAFMTGQPGKPAKSAAPYVDYSTAALATVGTLAALIERQTSGLGQHVEGSLLGTALAVFNSHLAEESATGIGRKPTGNRVQTSGPSDVFATKDGHVLIHVVGNGLFRKLASLIEADDWLQDESLQSDQDRGDRRDELSERVGAWCRELSRDEVLDQLAAAGVPAGPVLTLAETLVHPQTRALDLLKQVNYPGREGAAAVADLPIKLSRTPGGISAPPPASSQHSEEILAELGYEPNEIKGFRDAGLL